MLQLTRCIFIFYIFITLNHSPRAANYAEAFLDRILYYTLSHVYESCDERWVPQDVQGLKEALDNYVYGQPLAIDVITHALHSYVTRTDRNKPLVFNFHGWPGGGKSYTADFIVNYWLKKGYKSRFVKKYQAKLDFPYETHYREYQEKLKKDIEDTISKCHKAVFVFEEVDKFPPKVLDAVKPFIEYSSNVRGYDYRKALFIFITNDGQYEITNIVLKKMEDGVQRKDFKLNDFEAALQLSSFNREEGGFFKSHVIKHNLIDFFVPFLPMEKEHVELCIEAEFRRQGANLQAVKDATDWILKQLLFKPDRLPVFSSNGCKGVSEKLGYLIEKDRRQKKKHTEL